VRGEKRREEGGLCAHLGINPRFLIFREVPFSFSHILFQLSSELLGIAFASEF